MTPEEINIAIAEVCGIRAKRYKFKVMAHNGYSWWDWFTSREEADKSHAREGQWTVSNVEEFTDMRYVPNYHGDLNAMREARKTLTEDQQEVYAAQIVTILGWDRAKNNVFRIADADSSVHAEAFLRVHNLWRE